MAKESITTGDPMNSFSVMSFNLRFGLAYDGDNSWEKRQHAFPDLFKTFSPDFLGLQEANSFQGKYIEALLPNHAHIGMYDPAPEAWQDNLIFYRKSWKCLINKRYFISDTPAVESKLPESEWPRQCVIGLFEKNHKKLIHVNTHFDFKNSVQQRSAELLISFLSDFPLNIPVVITGDFNAAPHTSAYNILMGNGFNDTFEGIHSSTFHGFTGKNSGDHIDWILYKGDITAKDPVIIRDKFSNIYPSDHFPVIASFTL